MANSEMDASDILARLIYYTLLLFVLQLAFGVFGPKPDQRLARRRHPFPTEPHRRHHHLGGGSLASIASVVILFHGVIAALNQVGVATTVTTPVLIAILATVAGILIVGVGGGLIRPTRSRWETYLQSAEREAPRLRALLALSDDNAHGNVADCLT